MRSETTWVTRRRWNGRYFCVAAGKGPQTAKYQPRRRRNGRGLCVAEESFDDGGDGAAVGEAGKGLVGGSHHHAKIEVTLVNDPDSFVAFFATAAVMAHVASNRINQIQDPGLSIDQAIASFRRPGFIII